MKMLFFTVHNRVCGIAVPYSATFSTEEMDCNQ